MRFRGTAGKMVGYDKSQASGVPVHGRKVQRRPAAQVVGSGDLQTRSDDKEHYFKGMADLSGSSVYEEEQGDAHCI